eukprot:CFRG3590T1
MSQSWNAPAVRLAFDVILRRQWLAIPHYSVPDIRYINFAELKKAGCEGVVFDKDNCITNPYENNVCALVLPGWEECISVFGEKNILIMSNSVGSSDDHDFEEAIQLEKELSVRVVKHGSKKPNGHDAITEALGIGTEHLSQLAFVGDRVLTDVVGGTQRGIAAKSSFVEEKYTKRHPNRWFVYE